MIVCIDICYGTEYILLITNAEYDIQIVAIVSEQLIESKPTVLIAKSVDFPEQNSFVNISYHRQVDINENFTKDFYNWTAQHYAFRDSLLFIVNTGLWHNDKENYTEAMDRLTGSLLNLTLSLKHYSRPKSLAIVLAETTAQHFHTRTGYYDKLEYNRTKHEPYCKPFAHSASAHLHDWRNNILWERYVHGSWGESILKNPRVSLDVLPMFALTASLTDIHTRQYRQDCSHYCYTPMLYQPVYAHLKDISQRFLQLR